MSRTPEGAVKDAIKKLFRARGIWYYMPVQNGMGVVGVPDFICCLNGRFFGVEAKAPGKLNTLTANQQARHEEIRASGGLVLVVDDPSVLEHYLDKVFEGQAGVSGGVQQAP